MMSDADKVLKLEGEVEELQEMYRRLHEDWQIADQSNEDLRETLRLTVATVSAQLHDYGKTVGEAALMKEVAGVINSEMPALCPRLQTERSWDVAITVHVEGVVAFDEADAEAAVRQGHHDADVVNALQHDDVRVAVFPSAEANQSSQIRQ